MPRFFVTYEMMAEEVYGGTIFNGELEAESLSAALEKVREQLDGPGFTVSNDYYGTQHVRGDRIRGVSVGLYVADAFGLPDPTTAGELREDDLAD